MAARGQQRRTWQVWVLRPPIFYEKSDRLMPPAIVYFPPYTSTIQLWNLKICVSSTSYLSNSMIAIVVILESELKRKYTKAKTRCQPSYLSVLRLVIYCRIRTRNLRSKFQIEFCLVNLLLRSRKFNSDSIPAPNPTQIQQ